MSLCNELAWSVAAFTACGTAGGCVSGERNMRSAAHQAARPLVVELLALDLSTCGRCTGTDRNIESAVKDLRPVLAAAGVDLQFRKTVVETAEQAIALRFRSSPTVRINNADVSIEFRESRCGDCTSLSGGSSCSVDCRMWVWRGQEYTEAPTGLVVDAILRAYPLAFDASPAPAPQPFELPENLKRFYSFRDSDSADGARPCCGASQSKKKAISKR